MNGASTRCISLYVKTECFCEFVFGFRAQVAMDVYPLCPHINPTTRRPRIDFNGCRFPFLLRGSKTSANISIKWQNFCFLSLFTSKRVYCFKVNHSRYGVRKSRYICFLYGIFNNCDKKNAQKTEKLNNPVTWNWNT